MRSSWSLPLFRAFGVQVRADLSLLALVAGVLLWGLLNGRSGAVAGILGILLASVLLHEFGHAFAARRLGGSAGEIVLGPLGGLSSVDAPRTPMAQFWTAAAGPAVNLGLAALLGAWLHTGGRTLDGAFSWSQDWMSTALQMNAGLLLFNLIPGYPLDGGRMLQAACWPRMGYARSTRLALWLGVAAAFGMGVAGVAWGYWMLVAIAFVNFMACERERQALSATEPWEEPGFAPPEPSASPGWISRIRNARREKERLRREAREVRLRSRVDAILEKINRVGMQGLTPEERATLKEASDVFKHSHK